MNDAKKNENKPIPTYKERDEIIQTIKKLQTDKITTAEKTKRILEAYTERKKDMSLRTQMKEPIMFFGRRNGTFERYENVKQGRFDFTHSTGDKRFIIIDANKQYKLIAGRDQIRFYWAHEDYPTTGFPETITDTEQFNIFIDKITSDIQEWLTKKQGLKNQMILYIAIGIAIILLGYGLMKGMTGQGEITYNIINQANTTLNTTIQVASELGKQAIANGSQIL